MTDDPSFTYDVTLDEHSGYIYVSEMIQKEASKYKIRFYKYQISSSI